jgi:hypothetical protein
LNRGPRKNKSLKSTHVPQYPRVFHKGRRKSGNATGFIQIFRAIKELASLAGTESKQKGAPSVLDNWHDKLWSAGGLILTALYILGLILNEAHKIGINHLWH